MISLGSSLPPRDLDAEAEAVDMGLLVSAHVDWRVDRKSFIGEEREQEVSIQVRVSGIRLDVAARLQRP